MRHLQFLVRMVVMCLFASACASSGTNRDTVQASMAGANKHQNVRVEKNEPVNVAESIAENTKQNSCPKDKMASGHLHGVTQEMFSADYWQGQDRVIMDQRDKTRLRQRFYDPLTDLERVLDKDYLSVMMKERLSSFQKKFDEHEIMFEDGTVPPKSDFQNDLTEFMAHYNKANVKQYHLLEDTSILCAPHDRAYIKTQDGEVRFSRNLCSLGRAQARIEVLFTHADGMRFVRTADMWGWISPNAKLSPPLNDPDVPEEAQWFATSGFAVDGVSVPRGAFLAGKDGLVYLATPTGWKTYSPDAIQGIISTDRPLTQKAWIETLYLFLGDPYGWGGYGGWRDCSRLILDVARSFRIPLPRNSKEQAVKTSLYFQVEGMSPEDKLQKIDAAAQLGIVLLHFPGHIMAYLGRSHEGHPIVLHALSEYVERCDDATTDRVQQTLVHVDRVTLSDLSLGEGTTRTSFLERITHISLLMGMETHAIQNASEPWTVVRNWSAQEEMLFSAFVERLFDYPDEPDKTWSNLGDVLKDKNHNILYNVFGMDEDQTIQLEPDCADLPYMLRSYFAWKRGLPMLTRKCGRGTNAEAPKCGKPDASMAYHANGDETTRFNHYTKYVGVYRVHSGNARTALADEETDFYPVALDRASLRPGTIYADPYGHLLMIAHYVPDTPEAPGAMMAVDAQPDGTITRKRFWKGNFLFEPEMKNVGTGFKAFRPVVDGRQLRNHELDLSSGYVPYHLEQETVSKDAFYDRVEAAIHVKPLDIASSIAELTASLLESAERRVLSVQNGDDYIRANGADKMIMPQGYAVFETTGPWEDFATPSRDMRMLLAIDAVKDFPQQVRRNAKRYGLDGEEEVKDTVFRVERMLDEILEQEYVTYRNSKGQPVSLSLKKIVQRADAFEMAYHPADCNEIRWGASTDTEEYKTCSRRTNHIERAKMDKMRIWFKKRVRPARG